MLISSEKVRVLLAASLIGSLAACGGGSPDPMQSASVPSTVQTMPVQSIDSAQGVTLVAATNTASGSTDLTTPSFTTAPSFDTKASFDTNASFDTKASFTTNASFSTAPTFDTKVTFSALPS